MINKILDDITNNIPESSKDYKHNPFAFDAENVEKCYVENEKIYMKYKNNVNDTTIIFDYKEKIPRFFIWTK